LERADKFGITLKQSYDIGTYRSQEKRRERERERERESESESENKGESERATVRLGVQHGRTASRVRG
jgi:hypothetical protein